MNFALVRQILIMFTLRYNRAKRKQEITKLSYNFNLLKSSNREQFFGNT